MAQPLESTDPDLFFTIDGEDAGIVPIAVETGQSNPVSYDFGSGSVSLRVADAISMSGRYTDPLFCFDFSPGVSALASLDVIDANGHPVVAGLSLDGSLQYDLLANQIGVTPLAGSRCFYKGSSTNVFGLFGQPPFEPEAAPGDSIFGDAFLGEAVSIEFQGLPSFVTAGSQISYQLVVSNVSGRRLDNLGLQELFPANEDFFDATLTLDGWTCSGGVQCPSSSLNGSDSLRFQGFDMRPGETIVFDITRTVNGSSAVDSVIDLYAGVIAADTPLEPFDTAQTSTTVVGAGDSLSVAPAEATVGEDAVITVTALDAGQNPVPGIEVVIDNTDGLQVDPVGPTTTDPEGEVLFRASTTAAGDYSVQFSATDTAISPGTGTVSFNAAAPDAIVAYVDQNGAVANGSDQVLVKVYLEDQFENPVPGITVEVIDDGGLTSLPPSAVTAPSGIATLPATSEEADSYLIELAVSGQTSETVTVNFVAGDPADFLFVQGPTDTPEEGTISPAVVVQLVDENGNWIEDNDSVEITLQLRQGSSAIIPGLAVATVTDGQATFPGLSLDGVPAGIDYYLRAFGTFSGAPLLQDSTPFDITALVPDTLALNLDFDSQYSQGAQASGLIDFTYTQNAGDIEQIFNVFRVFDDQGEEVDPATYDAIFQSVSYGPAGYENYIRPLSGSSAANVVAPESVQITADFVLESTAPLGDYTLSLTSYDVTGEDPDSVSLGNADNGDYPIFASAVTDSISLVEAQ
ncbi:MAG: hypothetical protein GVY32_02980 [Gammaproteobacteria bacterium]|nr:hypothetical protein [Gammaproteobacteria bacterium]